MNTKYLARFLGVVAVLLLGTFVSRAEMSFKKLLSSLGDVVVSEVAAEGEKTDPLPAYQSIDISAGVFNNGQAALWDLPFLDHFKIFGPIQRAQGHKPEQPIPFSHVTHVQKNKMECQYCHWTVAKSPYAAIPEVQTCMGCHGVLVGGQTKEQQEAIAKLRSYWDAVKNEARPIPWQKVHVMPDYVRFNHKRHVKAGVNCQSCHGQVPKMEVVERVSSMKMGWCVDCHRQRGASIDCTTCHY